MAGNVTRLEIKAVGDTVTETANLLERLVAPTVAANCGWSSLKRHTSCRTTSATRADDCFCRATILTSGSR
jgi:hypothetical protein